MTEKQLRKELVKYGKKLVEKGLVSGKGGNISLKSGRFLYLSPGGFSLDEIKANQYVKINISKKIEASSSLGASCEMPMHLSCYRARADIGAVIHVHPPFALALGCAGKTIKALFPDFAVLLGRKVPLITYFAPGTEILGRKVKEALKNNQAVLLQNHGLVTVGKNLEEAYLRAETIEEAVKIYFISHLLGKVRFLTAKEIKSIQRKYKTEQASIK